MLIAGMMGGIELGKYDDIDFTPPQGVRDAAKRGLEAREKATPSQRGGTAVGIARARDLSGGKAISPETARRMKAFFDRHEVDKEGSTWSEQGKGWQAWQLWGGDAGYAWAKKLVKQMNSRDEKLSNQNNNQIELRDCGQDEGGTFGPKNTCAVGYGRPAEKGGYTPMRPSGKQPSIEKKSSNLPSKDKSENVVIPKYKLSDKQKAGKIPIPSKGGRILNDTADARDWTQYRANQLKSDPEAVWKVGELKMKGENLSFKDWKKATDNDITAYQVKTDFKGSEYVKLNPNPETKASQTLLTVIKKQAPYQQKEPMWRGLSFKDQKEADDFVGNLGKGMTLNRTLTSFTSDQSVAENFTAGSYHGPLYLKLTKSKGLRKFSDSEKEFVLPYKSRLRVIGKPIIEMVGRNKDIKSTTIEVEEY